MTQGPRVIRWGIWGAGTVAMRVAADLRRVPDARLQAVGARRRDKAEQVAAQGRAQRVHDSLAALAGDQEVDAIYVATPPALHRQDVLACIAAGKGVLCEKPFALDANEAQEMAEAARARGVFCMEALWTRFLPAVIRARQLVAAPSFGRVCLVHGDFSYPAPPDAAPWLSDPVAGGGVLLDRAVYLVSLAQAMLGPPAGVQMQAMAGAGGAEDQAALTLSYPGGALAQFSASFLAQGVNEMVVVGEGARLRLHEPFYAASRVSLEPSAAAAGSRGISSQPGSGTAGRLRRVLRESGLRSRLEPARDLLRLLRAQRFPYPGHGYQFQLAEASRCMASGRLESEHMPLADTIAVLRTLDAARSAWRTQSV